MTTIRNHITLIGNIGNDAEITQFDNGSKVARFNLSSCDTRAFGKSHLFESGREKEKCY